MFILFYTCFLVKYFILCGYSGSVLLNRMFISNSTVTPNVFDEIQVIEPHVDESSRQLYEVECKIS